MKYLTLLAIFLPLIASAGSYQSTIKQLQVEGVGDAYNTIYLNKDITDSPCNDSNQKNRFTIINRDQQAAAIAAVMANKPITLMTRNKCNAAGIEEVNFIMLKP